MRKLLDAYAQAAVERALAVNIGGRNSELAKHRIELERVAREAVDQELYAIEQLVSQALGEITNIEQAKPQQLSPTYANQLHRYRDRRPYSLKDAKPAARYAAKLLHQAWDQLAPPISDAVRVRRNGIELLDGPDGTTMWRPAKDPTLS